MSCISHLLCLPNRKAGIMLWEREIIMMNNSLLCEGKASSVKFHTKRRCTLCMCGLSFKVTAGLQYTHIRCAHPLLQNCLLVMLGWRP